MNWKVYTPQDLSNEEYQEHEAVSGSGLATIYRQSPAHYKFQEKEETAALAFGIAAHSMILEPEAFDAEFVRGIDVEQYPDALVTQKDMQAWLKDRGQKVSGSKPDLIGRILDIEPDTHVLDVLNTSHADENEGKTILKPEDFDAVQSMRNSIMQDDSMLEMLKGGFAEYSLIGEMYNVDVKTRPDLITSAGGIIQYKTTQDCHPAEFGRKIDNYGYLLKAALEWECFTRCYGSEPKYHIWLAQEKKAPFVWKPYHMTADALSIGRTQLDTALQIYEKCLEEDKWPAYGSEIEPIQIPDWLKKQYNVGER